MPDDAKELDNLNRPVERFEFDARTEPVSTAVVNAVATVTDSRPTEMTPLGSITNSDALDALFRPPATGAGRGDIHLSLEFEGQEITIHSYGVIEVRPADSE
jgi:hypothetical protein